MVFLQSHNGNVWFLTRQAVFIGEPPQTNPCGAKNNCPVESWIVNPKEGTAYLTSSQNGYLARVDADAQPLDDGYLRISWSIFVSKANVDRTEVVSQQDGKPRP